MWSNPNLTLNCILPTFSSLYPPNLSGLEPKRPQTLLPFRYIRSLASVMSNSLGPHGLWPARHLCLWNFPGKNTGVGCPLLLQGIFPNQRLNPRLLGLLHWQWILYHCATCEAQFPLTLLLVTGSKIPQIWNFFGFRRFLLKYAPCASQS